MGTGSTPDRLEEGLGHFFVGEIVDHRGVTRWERTGAAKELLDREFEALLVAPRGGIGGHLDRQATDATTVSRARIDAMAVTIELPPEALRRLEAEAACRGVGIEVVIAELASGLPEIDPEAAPTPRRRFGFVGVAASGDGSLSERCKDICRAEFDR